jgi:hypothetical protein
MAIAASVFVLCFLQVPLERLNASNNSRHARKRSTPEVLAGKEVR